MSTDQKLRASGTGNQNQLVYWALAFIAAGVLVWVWGGHRKDARVVQKLKSVTPQKNPAPAVPAPVRVAKIVPPPPIVPSDVPAEVVIAPQAPPRPVAVVKPVSYVEPPAAEVRVQPPPKSANKILDSQVALVRLGISPGSIDGVIGSQSRAAVRAFQLKAGLACTGT
ncbi:MAG TPA: peptidoglycan-binding domain-containing protein, partial [Candidatus Saccharimonadales bacterium]|nr:peptidoglycan-binding domain-containing protein [Candidatus Saccharimonadales bacterium]